MDILEYGMEVEVLCLGITGRVVETMNGGTLGRVKSSSGSDFTVFAEECGESGKEIDPLDRMFCEAIGLDKFVVPRNAMPSMREDSPSRMKALAALRAGKGEHHEHN